MILSSKRWVRSLGAAVVGLVLVVSTSLVGHADSSQPLLTNLRSPMRSWVGSPNSAMLAAESQIMTVVSEHQDVFAGGAYSANYDYIEMYHAANRTADAQRLIGASGASATHYRLISISNSAATFQASIRRIIAKAASENIAWTEISPNEFLDGVDVGIPSRLPDSELQHIHDLLRPLGMVRLGVVPAGDLYGGSDTDVYGVEGYHFVNGRQWRTTCESYSQTSRCRTEIFATTIQQVNGRFVATNDWTFNNLTYLPSPRSLWSGNNLAQNAAWTALDGRAWRTECDTPVSGRNGCRSYVIASYIETVDSGSRRSYRWTKGWVFNNIVRFGESGPPRPSGV